MLYNFMVLFCGFAAYSLWGACVFVLGLCTIIVHLFGGVWTTLLHPQEYSWSIHSFMHRGFTVTNVLFCTVSTAPTIITTKRRIYL